MAYACRAPEPTESGGVLPVDVTRQHPAYSLPDARRAIRLNGVSVSYVGRRGLHDNSVSAVIANEIDVKLRGERQLVLEQDVGVLEVFLQVRLAEHRAGGKRRRPRDGLIDQNRRLTLILDFPASLYYRRGSGRGIHEYAVPIVASLAVEIPLIHGNHARHQ